MAIKMKATHRGNCQVCGGQQCIVDAVLVKHGYTVKYGYFHGTCPGSGCPPVQVERTLTHATIVSLDKLAAASDDLVANLRAGTAFPMQIRTGEKFNPTTGRYESMYIAWDAGDEYQQSQALERAIYAAEGGARRARARASDLRKLADELHGMPLVAIDDSKQVRTAAKCVHGSAGGN